MPTYATPLKEGKKMKSESERMFQALEYMRSITNRPRMEIQQLSILIKLHSLRSAVTMQELANMTPGTSQSIISRNSHAFASKSKPGARRLLEIRVSDEDVRFRTVELTADGREIMATFLGIVDGSQQVPKGTRPAVDSRTL